MANKRIKDLSTTAAVTASDDFIAVDGATNGTRKLDAYSPTFGGNLTVSGTGGISIGSATFTGGRALTATTGSGNNVALRLLQTSVADWEIKNVATTGALSFQQSASDLMSLSASGNLTVSGTGTSSFAGNLTLSTSGSRIATGTSDGTDNKYISFSGGGAAANTRGSSVYVTGNEFTTGNAKGSLQLEAGYDATMSNTMDGSVLFSTGGTAVVGYFNRLGNLILGPAAADGGNGKLQLATHTTSAGGIGFGTDISLYRTTANILTFGAGNACGFYLRDTNTSTNLSEFYSDTSQTFFGTKTALPLIIRTNNTTALTLDSSQNATFAGDIRFSLANTFDIGQTGTRVRAAYIRTLVITSNAPAAANSTGTSGTVTWDANYLYVCTATDTWKRVAIATWP